MDMVCHNANRCLGVSGAAAKAIAGGGICALYFYTLACTVLLGIAVTRCEPANQWQEYF